MGSVVQSQAKSQAQQAINHEKEHSKVGVTWVSLAVFMIILLLLAIFILQNGTTVQIRYFGFHGSLPFGVGMLLAAVAGAVLTLLVGSVRIVQLKSRHSTTSRSTQ